MDNIDILKDEVNRQTASDILETVKNIEERQDIMYGTIQRIDSITKKIANHLNIKP